MRKTAFVLIGAIMLLIGCKDKEPVYNTDRQAGSTEEKKLGDKKFIYTETHFSGTGNCPLDELLEDPKISKMAKQLYSNTYKLVSDEPLNLLKELHNPDANKRLFYFKAITNSKKKTDGAYSEGLGFAGKEYVEKNTAEFAANFDNAHCFSKEDLASWADIVMLEVSIMLDKEKAPIAIEEFNKSLFANCKDCTKNQKETIKIFTILLKQKSAKYFAEQE
jgi:hypothetical protein